MIDVRRKIRDGKFTEQATRFECDTQKKEDADMYENTRVDVDLIDPELKRALKAQAKKNGRTMRTEARFIIEQILIANGEYRR